MLSISYPKLYTNFEFCEEKNHIYLKNLMIYKAKQTTMTQKNPGKAHIL